MLPVLSLVLPLLGSPELPAVGLSTLATDEPPVRLWINGDRRFEPGDRARVQVESRDDGFLLVLNYDTDGRVRVLYPLDPRDDGFVRGGRRYEVRDERASESFVIGTEGAGFVYVALSPDPWDLRGWARGGNWDYDRVAINYDTEDPERDLTSLLEGIAGPRGFDYDLLEYFVHDVEVVRYEYDYRGPRFYGPGVWAGDPWCDPYWSTGWFCSARPGVVINYGRYYRDSWWSVGYGPSWYWPYESWYRYRPYSYGRGYYLTYHRPWVWTTPTYRPLNRPIIVGRSRDYSVGRLSPWTFASGDRSGAPRGRAAASLPDSYRSPVGGGVRARPSTGDREVPAEARGRPVTERTGPPAATGRARPSTGGSGQSGEARPTGRRTGGGEAAPAARPSTGRATPPTARARPRGNDEAAASRETAASRGSSSTRTASPARSTGQARPVDRARVSAPTSRPAAPAARNAPSSSSRPAASGASRAPASRPAAQSRQPASRPAVSAARPASRQAPASSRGSQSRPRGRN